jgi:hypothetical protein
MIGDPTVVSGYGFATPGPYLVIDDLHPGSTSRRQLTVRDAPLTLTATDTRRCTGYFDLVTYESLPCPEQSPIGADVDTCYKCFRRTGFNPSFYNMPLDGISPQQRSYNEREHVVYLAYFADGWLKVGISSRDRVFVRLRGQGARLATLLVAVADAYEARALEERIVKDAAIPETLRAARKRNLVNEPFDRARAERVLLESRKRVEETCETRPLPFAVHDFSADYLGSYALDLPVTDLTDESPISISGRGVGLIGDVLVVEESGRQFMVSVKELVGRVVTIEPTVRRNVKKPASGQLGFGFG